MNRRGFLSKLVKGAIAAAILPSIVDAVEEGPVVIHNFRQFTWDGITVYWKPFPMFDQLCKYPLTERKAFQKLDMSDYEEERIS